MTRRRPRVRRPRGRVIIRIPTGPIYYYDYDYWGYSRISCDLAALTLQDRGYYNIRAYDCAGTVYGFYARRNGRRYRLRVSARTGSILSRVRY